MSPVLVVAVVGCTAETFNNEKIVDVRTDSGVEAAADSPAVDALLDIAPEAVADAAADVSPDRDPCLAANPRLEWREGACYDTGIEPGKGAPTGPFRCSFRESTDGRMRCLPEQIATIVGAVEADCPLPNRRLVDVVAPLGSDPPPYMLTVATKKGHAAKVARLCVVFADWRKVDDRLVCADSNDGTVFPWRNASGYGTCVGTDIGPELFYTVP